LSSCLSHPDHLWPKLAKDINGLEPRLTREGYNVKVLAELLNAKPREIKEFLRGQLAPKLHHFFQYLIQLCLSETLTEEESDDAVKDCSGSISERFRAAAKILSRGTVRNPTDFYFDGTYIVAIGIQKIADRNP
jgi:hypothetical protein